MKYRAFKLGLTKPRHRTPNLGDHRQVKVNRLRVIIRERKRDRLLRI